jgi:hypothetical protein
MRMSFFVAIASLCVLCNSSCDGGPTCKAYVVPTGTNLMTPTVSFKNDVMPVFVQSCTFVACHGSMSANNGIYLGEHVGMTNTTMVVSALAKPSLILPSMPFVTAGNPDQSLLMHKMDGDQCTLAMKCVNGSCGGSMPSGDPILPVANRDVVRRWIAQGAKDN